MEEVKICSTVNNSQGELMNSYKQSNGPGQTKISVSPLFGDNCRVPQGILDRNIAINTY